MAKRNRYRWQNEKRAIKKGHDARNAHAHAMAEMRARNAARAKAARTPVSQWGSRLCFYELVSMSPLKYRRVASPAERKMLP